ncbi:MAG: ATP synthase F1 subunit gamma [Tidjanibacter sp.]|nr:ATP synthase F1 subunit gamma [Tidjanibacter sp.]
MGSLREIKARIGSIRSTRKITSAMKMVSAAKLHKSQAAIASIAPYSQTLGTIADNLVAGVGLEGLPLAAQREVGTLVIIAISSNGTLCGSFNEKVFERVRRIAADYPQLPPEKIRVCAIGSHVAEEAVHAGMNVTQNLHEIAEKPIYEAVASVAQKYIDDFLSGTVDRVELVYHRFRSAGSSTLVTETLLPVEIEPSKTDHTEYILEPSREELIEQLLPFRVKLQLFTASLSSAASEHAARMAAMQAATENADEMISDLTVEYNKSRQEAITNELLDIMGGQNK